MSSTETIINSLNGAERPAETLSACWDAFDFIQNSAAAYAEPGSSLFYVFLGAVSPACEGRDLAGSAPSMPTQTGNAPPPLNPATTSPEAAADALAELATLMSRKLTEAAALPSTTPGDEKALAAARQAATEIIGLLKSP